MHRQGMTGKKILIALVVVLIGWSTWSYFAGTGKDAAKKPATPVSVASVERRDVPLVLSAVGNVVADETVAVRSRLDSQLMEIKFKDGDYVNAGDLLFVLDDRPLIAQINQQKANLERDKAQIANLRQQYERSRALKQKDFVSQADLDAAKAAYEAQRGIVAASQAAVESVSVQLQYTRITAPISGRTGTINLTVGNTVKANDTTPLVTINQVKPIRVQLSLPQRYLQSVRDAMEQDTLQVIATREGGSDTSTGTLEYIDNAVDTSTGTFAARATFVNEDEKLWPGMFVTLSLTLGEEKQAVVIPEVAVQHWQDGDYVFVVNEGKAEKKPVKISRVYESTAVMESGVEVGQQVVVDGVLTLREGSPVTTQSPEPAATPEAATP